MKSTTLLFAFSALPFVDAAPTALVAPGKDVDSPGAGPTSANYTTSLVTAVDSDPSEALLMAWFAKSVYQKTRAKGGQVCGDLETITAETQCHIEEVNGYIFQERIDIRNAEADVYKKGRHEDANGKVTWEVCLVAFRGSETSNWGRDFWGSDAGMAVSHWVDVKSGIKLPFSFYGYYQSLAYESDGIGGQFRSCQGTHCISKLCADSKETISTGHSLGAAASISMGHDYIDKSHTTFAFASPRIVKMEHDGHDDEGDKWKCPQLIDGENKLNGYHFFNSERRWSKKRQYLGKESYSCGFKGWRTCSRRKYGEYKSYGRKFVDPVATASTCLRSGTLGGLTGNCMTGTCTEGNYELKQSCEKEKLEGTTFFGTLDYYCPDDGVTHRDHDEVDPEEPEYTNRFRDSGNKMAMHLTKLFITNLHAWVENNGCRSLSPCPIMGPLGA